MRSIGTCTVSYIILEDGFVNFTFYRVFDYIIMTILWGKLQKTNTTIKTDWIRTCNISEKAFIECRKYFKNFKSKVSYKIVIRLLYCFAKKKNVKIIVGKSLNKIYMLFSGNAKLLDT